MKIDPGLLAIQFRLRKAEAAYEAYRKQYLHYPAWEYLDQEEKDKWFDLQK